MCDLVGIIDQGRLLKMASPAELVTGQANHVLHIQGTSFTPQLIDHLKLHRTVKNAGIEGTTLKVELSDDSAANEIIALVAQSGADILKVDRGNSGLEDVFVNLIKEEK